MRKQIAFLLTVIFLAACGSNKVPAGIISSERMGTIMWQLMESDEYVNLLLSKDTTKKSSTERMKKYQQVFDLNKTSLDEFKKSYQYYLQHPEIGKVIFDSMTVKAGRERTALFSRNADTLSQKADSIRRIRIADSLARSKPDSLHLRPVPTGKKFLKPDTLKPVPVKPPKKRLKKIPGLLHN